MFIRKGTSFKKFIYFWGILSILGMSSLILLVYAIYSYYEFNHQINEIRQNYIANQKKIIHNEVMRIVEMIKIEESHIKNQTKEIVKNELYEAYTVAQYIYQHNKDHYSEEELQKMIVNAINALNAQRDGDYYFILTNTNAKAILFPSRPELTGKVISEIKENKADVIVKNFINIINTKGEGYSEYKWNKPGKSELSDKITYVKNLDMYGWFIAYGLYTDDIKKELKQNLLNRIKRIHYGKNGYIFISDYNCNTILLNHKIYSGKEKTWDIFFQNDKEQKEKQKKSMMQNYAKIKKKGCDYFSYKFIKPGGNNIQHKKYSFTYGIPEWNWVIGTGFYCDDVDQELALMQDKFYKKTIRHSTYFFLITALIIAGGLLIFYPINKIIKNDIEIFTNFLKRGDDLQALIPRENLIFSETDEIAESANKMLTLRAKAEKELEKLEKKVLAMVESTTDWIWEVDADLKCTYVTPNVESGIGYKPEELIGKTFEEMVRKEDIDKARELQEKLKKNPVPFKNFETVVIHKNGNEIFTERNAIPLFDSDGKFTGYIGVSRDITQKKQDEARSLQNQKMEELGTVAAGVAHDFNNMLTGVYGNIELAMLHLAKDSPAYNFISQAHKINKETTLLTNKLLTFSKGALPNLHSINLPRLVKEVVEHLNNNKINIDYKIDENLPNIMGDSQLLKTAIFNVIKNAVEHAEECSKILIEMSKTKYSTEASESSSINEGVKLVIKDNGQGISQNIISKIFDPYFSTKKMGIHGQGLGLSVTQNIIKKHFGEISVTSSKEHGTAFSIILPVATENQTKEPVKCRENSLKTPDLALEERTPKVIIMDDEPLIIEICSGMLKTNGFMDIDSAENGDEVIEKYKKAMKNGNKYDIVILDLMVTEGKGGLEAVKEILKIDSDANIIVSSGYATDPVLKAYKSYGFKAALPKPYTVNDLKNIIKELLS